jgi:hypothetical protein
MASQMLLALAVLSASAAAAVQPAPGDPITQVVERLERALAAGNGKAISELVAQDAPREGIDQFIWSTVPSPSRAVVKERDRLELLDGRQRLLLEVLIERGIEGELSTWRLDLSQTAGAWRIAAMERLGYVSGLYRLALNPTKQFNVRNLTLTGIDLRIEMPSGIAFVAETLEGPTAVVLLGRGVMRFSPPDAAEKTQVRLFSGSDALAAEFNSAFIRVRPSEFNVRFSAESLQPRAVARRDFRRANEIFDEFIGRTLQLDLMDMSRERWSLAPPGGDLIAEVRTRKYGDLTYARSGNDAEDVSVFERRRRRNISAYASAQKLAARGRFYSEDELVEYDVLSYDIAAAFDPERLWVTGRSHVAVRVRAAALATMTLRLANDLVVRSVYAQPFGRLLHLRVVGQNSVIVNLPTTLVRGSELLLEIDYNGRLEPQQLDREAVAVSSVAQDPQYNELLISPEAQYIYSNRSYWYPQSTVTDYATATLRLTVPHGFDIVASGDPVGGAAPEAGVVAQGQRARKVFVFDTARPVRYLACVISRFNAVGVTTELNVPSPDPPSRATNGDAGRGADVRRTSVTMFVQANPRQTGRARNIAERSSAIFRYYASLMAEAPYPTFTLAVAEGDLPGGHSPAYFALLNQQLPTSPLVWRNDPVSFSSFPSFFLAHEIAHQWWGQAIGWKNYHEQWLSEGLAQYFAALYAAHEGGEHQITPMLRQMRSTALDNADQGPVYLGYRLGHIKNDGRVFRAIVYNKAAMVLHMLRRLVGDEAFFAGLRRFYTEWRFRKAGTNDLRLALQEISGRDLNRFFEAWIYGSATPRVRFTYRLNGAGEATLRFEHLADVMEVPITATITYASGETQTIVVPVTEQVVERTVSLKGVLRTVSVNDDHAALVEIEKSRDS